MKEMDRALATSTDFMSRISGLQETEKALPWLIGEFIALKISCLSLQKEKFEERFGMPLADYEAFALDSPEHLWEDEKTIIEWDKTVSLLSEYQKIQGQGKLFCSSNA